MSRDGYFDDEAGDSEFGGEAFDGLLFFGVAPDDDVAASPLSEAGIDDLLSSGIAPHDAPGWVEDLASLVARASAPSDVLLTPRDLEIIAEVASAARASAVPCLSWTDMRRTRGRTWSVRWRSRLPAS